MSIQPLKAHLAINVRNVSASLAFYRKLFGAEPSKVRDGYAKFDLASPPLNFTLNQHPFEGAGALSHLGIQVASTEDVLSIREMWHRQGLITRDEMQTNCCFAKQDKTWVKDPDGNEWEVFVVLEDNLPELPASPRRLLRSSAGGSMKTYIFACVHSAGRSQMSAAFFNVLANPRLARGVSAGTEPAERVHPVVVEAMREVGIDLTEAKPRKLTRQLAEGAEMLITMGCGDECPYVPGLRREDWALPDPKKLPVEEVRAVRDDIRERVAQLVRKEKTRLCEVE